MPDQRPRAREESGELKTDAPDPSERARLEVEVEPTVAGRFTRWMERVRVLQERTDAARARHSSVDFGFTLVERDSSIGGGLLAGALAYRLFVLLLPTALLLVSALGLYSSSVDESPGKIAKDAGLHGLIGSQVAEAASGRHRGVVFVLMIPAVLYALVTLYRAIAAGEFPAVRIGRRLFIPARVLDRMAEAAIATGHVVTAADFCGEAS